MKRYWRVYLLVVLYLSLGLYGLGAAIAWDLNPANWHPAGRAILILFGIGVMSAATNETDHGAK